MDGSDSVLIWSYLDHSAGPTISEGGDSRYLGISNSVKWVLGIFGQHQNWERADGCDGWPADELGLDMWPAACHTILTSPRNKSRSYLSCSSINAGGFVGPGRWQWRLGGLSWTKLKWGFGEGGTRARHLNWREGTWHREPRSSWPLLETKLINPKFSRRLGGTGIQAAGTQALHHSNCPYVWI